MKHEQFTEENYQTFFFYSEIFRAKTILKPTQIEYTLILQNLGRGHFVKIKCINLFPEELE